MMEFSGLYTTDNIEIYLAKPNSFNHCLGSAIAETHIYQNSHVEYDYTTKIEIFRQPNGKIQWYATFSDFIREYDTNPKVTIELPKFPDMHKDFANYLSTGYVNQIIFVIDRNAKEVIFFIEFEEAD